MDEILPILVGKTMVTYVLYGLEKCLLATCTFELWKGAHDIFVVVINFLSNKWEAKRVTIGLFEVSDTNGATVVPKLQLFHRFSFIHKIFAHVKDEGSNL